MPKYTKAGAITGAFLSASVTAGLLIATGVTLTIMTAGIALAIIGGAILGAAILGGMATISKSEKWSTPLFDCKEKHVYPQASHKLAFKL